MTEKYNDDFLIDNYKALGAAILIRAIRDYETYAYTEFGTTSANKAELEKFFKSQWCMYLINTCCDMDIDTKDVLPTLQNFLIQNKNMEKFDKLVADLETKEPEDELEPEL